MRLQKLNLRQTVRDVVSEVLARERANDNSLPDMSGGSCWPPRLDLELSEIEISLGHDAKNLALLNKAADIHAQSGNVCEASEYYLRSHRLDPSDGKVINMLVQLAPKAIPIYLQRRATDHWDVNRIDDVLDSLCHFDTQNSGKLHEGLNRTIKPHQSKKPSSTVAVPPTHSLG